MGSDVNNDQQLDRAFAQLPTNMSGSAIVYGGPVDPSQDPFNVHMSDTDANPNEAENAKSKSFSLNPFKSTKKVTKDGQPPKKRGPKPDSRPAATRRQELNRQAQRTHRERKELYTKQIEAELVRLKEDLIQEITKSTTLTSENERLMNLLNVNGIQYDQVTRGHETVPPRSMLQHQGSHMNFSSPPQQTHYAVSAYGSGSQSVATSGAQTAASSQALSSRSASQEASVSPPPSLTHGGSFPPRKTSVASPGYGSGLTSPSNTTVTPYNNQPQESFLGARGTPNVDASVPQQAVVLDHDQIGIDFVLALEENCHDHKTFMIGRTFNDPEEAGGHALMLTCPPVDYVTNNTEGDPYPHRLPDAPKEGLLKLMDISPQMPIQGGELTPALAWKVICQDQRFSFLDLADFHNLTTYLKARCRCYGWGAVVEQLEVFDTLDQVFAAKSEFPRLQSAFTSPVNVA